MTQHVSDHLSALLDDELDPAVRAGVEAHLRGCEACAADLAGLRLVVAEARAAAGRDAPPPRDLWSGIHARIASPGTASFADAAARRLPPRRTTLSARRIALTVPQLAAAAVLLMALAAAAAWVLRGGAPAGGADAVIHAEIEPTPAADAVRPVNFADAQYDAAVADLERALDERRNDLHPRTVEILERNLKLIDAAIAQARQALEEDPANAYLNRHLVESRRRKLELLRRAAAMTDGV